MRRQSYDAIATRLQSLDDRLSEAGFSKNDRIRVQTKNILKLADAQRSGTLELIASQLESSQRRELMWSFVECLELEDALQALHTQQCPVPREVLDRALSGPTDPSAENERNNLGRNTAFELILAGDLAAAGLQPQLGTEPDIVAEFLGRRLLIACKRPFRGGTIRGQIEAAAKQLGRKLQSEANPRDCGLIAVSVTRAFTSGDGVLEITSHTEVHDYLDGELRTLARENESALRNVKSPKIAGLILHISTPGHVTEGKFLITAAQTLIVHIAGKSDWALLDELGRVLKSTITV